ncbi:MAG: hypothetical protein V2B19_08265 [Pseudomonadota bacterium]
MADLGELLKGLSDAGIEFILVGGVAAVAQGAPIMTYDLDIVHRRTEENVMKLMTFLSSIDARHRRPDDKLLFPNEADLRGRGHVLLTTRFGPLDVLAVIEKGLGFEELLPNTVLIEFQGYRINVLNLETIVALKSDSNVSTDPYRLAILKETLQQLREEENGG